MSSDSFVLAKVLYAVLLGGDILKKLTHQKLYKGCKWRNARLSGQEHQWPPTPREILEKKNMNISHNNLFNLVTLIVSPNSPWDENGTVTLSHVKATKVSKICDDNESLISNSKPSLSQVLISLNT